MNFDKTYDIFLVSDISEILYLSKCFFSSVFKNETGLKRRKCGGPLEEGVGCKPFPDKNFVIKIVGSFELIFPPDFK